MLFAFTFFGLNALTGWTLFGWYAYPLVPALIAALVLIHERWVPSLDDRWTVAIAMLIVVAVPSMGVRYYLDRGPRWSIADNTILASAFNLEQHVRGRTGLFAMGAIAGVVGYVLDKPVLQIEGIMADQRMVEHVRRQSSLGAVLRE